MPKFIALERQFFSWKGENIDVSSFPRKFLKETGALSWPQLEQFRRVVILAEAGSGKTQELQQQTRRRADQDGYAFFMLVEDVADTGFIQSLKLPDRQKFESWKNSDRPAWLFIDSVDEAKLRGFRIEKAFRQIAEAIYGMEKLAHIILSCRPTDWEPEADLHRLNEWLPIPANIKPESAPDLAGEVRRILRNEQRREEPPPEEPQIVLMAPLDAERIRKFVVANGIKEDIALLAEIERLNLWQFARRPVDLSWLVDYWKNNQRFGTLAQMLETSLEARSHENNPQRAQKDQLSAANALKAAERIGAALVLCKRTTVAIPDAETKTASDFPLKLLEILPDWQPALHQLLLTRPLFDAATFGRARLHNDNESVVRSFLAAKWVISLRERNLPITALYHLLFQTTYGLEFVRPSLARVAAWLCLWDSNIARQVVQRSPTLLLVAGDPASLPPSVREAALERIVEGLLQGSPVPMLWDHDTIRRFVQPDMGRCVKALWEKHNDDETVRRLLLPLVRIGQLSDCRDFVAIAAHGCFDEGRSYSQLYGISALAVIGSEEQKLAFAEYFNKNATALPNFIIIEAIDGFFPSYIKVGSFLAILDHIDVTDSDGGLSIEWRFGEWVERVNDVLVLQDLLAGLLQQLGPEPLGVGHIPTKRDETYIVGIATAASQLLKYVGPNEAPEDVVNAALRIAFAHHYGRPNSVQNLPNLATELSSSEERRRTVFWQSVSRWSGHRLLQEQNVTNLWQIEIFGFNPGLVPEDWKWLVRDGLKTSLETNKKLVVHAALTTLERHNADPALWEEVRETIKSDPVMVEAFIAITAPKPTQNEDAAFDDQFQVKRQELEKQTAERDQSWITFIARIRSNPEELAQIGPPTSEGVDNRLFGLWELLRGATSSENRYAITNLEPLVPLLGQTVTEELRAALIRFWRQWQPKLKSQKKLLERNQMPSLDCMGIAGVSLEAASNPTWASKLTEKEAILAAQYATLELNGFPPWMNDLARNKPNEVREVLLKEIVAELDDPDPRTYYEILSPVARAEPFVGSLLAVDLFEQVKLRLNIPATALASVLSITVSSYKAVGKEILALFLERFRSMQNPAISGLYLRAAFEIDDVAASGALLDRIRELPREEQTQLALEVLPGLMGTNLGGGELPPPTLSFDVLEALVRLAFDTINVSDDIERPQATAFSPTVRDNAQHARDLAFTKLANIPGFATYQALQRLKSDPTCPIGASRLEEFAVRRAETDSDLETWFPVDVLAFEKRFDFTPRSAASLQELAMFRLGDIQHELLHGDFNQGPTVKALPHEREVQNWIADRLRQLQGHCYSVEREPHVNEEKEPDVRLRAKASDASLAIEIKVPESWTIAELEQALVVQLCKQYLRSSDARHGILLLVHQNSRAQGWIDQDTGIAVDLPTVVDRLRTLADKICATSADSPQPKVLSIDVSSCGVRESTSETPVKKRPIRSRRLPKETI